LLGDPEQLQQIADRHFRILRNEVEGAMMRAAQSLPVERFVGGGREIGVTEI